MTINNCTWKAFQMEEVFQIESGKRLEKRNMVPGKRPFIGSTDKKNGITSFVSNINSSIDRNLLGVNYNGSVGEAFYHEYECLFSDDVKRLHLKKVPDDKHILLFMAVAIRKQKDIFQYGYKFNKERMKKQVIFLPVDVNGEPDYEFMKMYVKKLIYQKYNQYKTHALQKIKEIEAAPCTLPLAAKTWGKCSIKDVFTDTQRGRRLKKADQTPGKTPYVSSTANNNGVDGFIHVPFGSRTFKDCISLANSGSVGVAFYEPFSYVASDHVTHLKKDGLSPYQYLFLIGPLIKQKNNFDFNREIKDERLEKMNIMLPVKEDGKPDFDYMERYGRAIMLAKYQQYLSYLKKKGI